MKTNSPADKNIKESKVADQSARQLKWEQDRREAAEKIDAKKVACVAIKAVRKSLEAEATRRLFPDRSRRWQGSHVHDVGERRDALATDQAADQSRSRTMGASGVTMVSKDRYEVVASIG
jgi:hypothetical protein